MLASTPSVRRILELAILLLVSIEFPPSPSRTVSAHTADRRVSRVRIGVLGLFHSKQMTINAIAGHALLLNAGEDLTVLESTSGVTSATIQLSGSNVVANAGNRVFRSSELRVSGRDGEPVYFQLAVPNKIARRYQGVLEIKSVGSELVAIVTMDLETAVASVVAAESTSDAPIDAIKAQAVITRSYLISGRGRHLAFDFCDTTHCQFLREPPMPGTSVPRAVDATRGMVLAYNSHPFPAMYTRSCSGHTRTPAQVGLPSNNYPYYSTDCKYCLSHPSRWISRISLKDAASLRSSDEASRLRAARRLGWSTVPSSDFNSTKDGGQVLLRGMGFGHGIGLCQAGARAMAEDSASFREILSHYYPNTAVIDWSPDH